MAAMVSNYAQVTNWILEKAVTLDNVNTAFEGDIYSFNYLEGIEYPVVFVSATRPVTETENYWTYNLTLYYVSRVQEETEDTGNPDSLLIRSNGIIVLSKLINAIRNSDWCYDLGYNNGYVCFGQTSVFADICLGVYTDISLKVPKINVC